jgi:cysteine-rich repeat protein
VDSGRTRDDDGGRVIREDDNNSNRDTGSEQATVPDAAVDSDAIDSATTDVGLPNESGPDAGNDAAMTDVGAPSDAYDDSAFDASDTTTDTTSPPDVPPITAACGNGVVDRGESCDDGNEVETDGCRSDCTRPVCGDGVVSVYTRVETLNSPMVTNPAGQTGYVCDDFSSCSSTDDCDVTANGSAEEHGICQALGFERAVSVNWGGGAGDSFTPMPHAFNWDCVDFVCGASADTGVSDTCSVGEMLLNITCDGSYEEACDAGESNTNDADAPCRPDCTLPGCGDGVTDTGEECDDGNDVENDGCSSVCLLPQCGDGVVQGDEACDDGDDDNGDECTTLCTLPACGDGFVGRATFPVTLTSPVVPNPAGARGHVCDDGATCQASSCNVAANPRAPEHGICQSLGYNRAISVVWGGGDGASDSTMPHAYNWTCTDYECRASTSTSTTDNCSSSEMLLTIVCENEILEFCDDGEANGTPGSECSAECRPAGCGDGSVDSDEECDDGNSVDSDLCSNTCTSAYCGDGYLQTALGEQCDDAEDNGADAGLCAEDCLYVPIAVSCDALSVGSATGDSVLTGTTAGRSNDESGSCGGAAGADQKVTFRAPETRSYTLTTNGSSFDTVLYVRSASDGTCGGAQLGCDDDGGSGTRSSVRVNLSAGQVVVIIIDGFGGGSGTWALNITPG